MELNRIWHEPEVVIYACLITPGTRCSGAGYDLANRRWYQLNFNSGNYDEDSEDWMTDILEPHISTYYHTWGKETPFNVINATRDGSSLTFDTQPNHVIARPIRETLEYCSKREPAIPITSFDRLVDNASLGRSVDICRWNGQDCAFKRVEFDYDVKGMEREIKSREKLLELPDLYCQTNEDANKVMVCRFNILPILAVVVFEQDVNNDVMGILMPFGGLNLESLSASGTDYTASASGSKDLKITREQLRDLTRGVRNWRK